MKKTMFKRLSALLLAAVLIIGMVPVSVLAADGNMVSQTTPSSLLDLDKVAPAGYDVEDTTNPYGYDVGVPFTMSDKNELFVLQGANRYSASKTAAIYEDMKEGEAQTGRVLNSFNTRTNISTDWPGALNWLNFTQAVSFDPMASGKKDHVAIIGVDSEKDVWLIVYSLEKDKWSSADAKLKLGKMTWVTNDTHYYGMNNFFSITAGDYDNDDKETLVTYFAGNGGDNKDGYGLSEITVIDTDNDVVITNVDGAGALHKDDLNTEYVKNYDAFCKNDGSSYGAKRLICSLDTGDINGDRVDDLAVMSYTKATDPNYPVEMFIPQLTVRYGYSDAQYSWNSSDKKMDVTITPHDLFVNKAKTETTSVYTGSTTSRTSMCTANLTVTNADGKAGDEVIVGGQHVVYTVNASGKYSSQSRNAYYNIAKYTFNDSKLTQDYLTHRGIDVKGSEIDFDQGQFTANWNAKYDMWPQLSVEGVYMNGPGNPAYIEIGGDLFECSGETPQKVFDLEPMNHRPPGDVSLLGQAAVGNFEGNIFGYEQIIFPLVFKNDTRQDDYNISYCMIGFNNTLRNEDGLPTTLENAFYASSQEAVNTLEINDKGDNLDEALTCLFVPVDRYCDAAMVRYRAKDYGYSDPYAIAVLQAPPYYEEFADCYDYIGNTSFNYYESISIGKGSSDNVSFGLASVTDMKTPIMDIELGAGYALDWTQSFEHTITVEGGVGWSTGSEDSVIVARTPWVFYSYDVAVDDGNGGYEWQDDALCIAVEGIPTISQMLIDNMYLKDGRLSVMGYNGLVDAYNEKMKAAAGEGQFTPMTRLDETSGICHAGDPRLYKGGSGFKSLPTAKSSTKRAEASVGTVSYDSTISKEDSKTVDMGHGFSFELAMKFGFEAFGFGVKTGFDVSLDHIHSNSTSEAQGVSMETTGIVANIPARAVTNAGFEAWQYAFDWQYGIWNSNIVQCEDAETGTRYTPVLGYRVLNCIAPPKPPTGGEGDDNGGEEKLYANTLLTAPVEKVQTEATGVSPQGIGEALTEEDDAQINSVSNDAIENGSHKITWDQPEENAGITGYEIYRLNSTTGEYEWVLNTTSCECVVEATGNPVDQYIVMAVNDHGRSPASAPIYCFSGKYFDTLKYLSFTEQDLIKGLNTLKLKFADREPQLYQLVRDYALESAEFVKYDQESNTNVYQFNLVNRKDTTDVKTIEVPVKKRLFNDKHIKAINKNEEESQGLMNVFDIIIGVGDDPDPDNDQTFKFSFPNGKSGKELLPDQNTCDHADFQVINKDEPTEDAVYYTGDTYCVDCEKLVEKGHYVYPVKADSKALTWAKESGSPLSIAFDMFILNFAAFDHDAQQWVLKDGSAVLVDDQVVDPKNYVIKEGYVIIEFLPQYLETLNEGVHTVKLQCADGGEASTTFTIAGKGSPVVPGKDDNGGQTAIATGITVDNNALSVAVVCITLALVGGVLVICRRKQR